MKYFFFLHYTNLTKKKAQVSPYAFEVHHKPTHDTESLRQMALALSMCSLLIVLRW